MLRLLSLSLLVALAGCRSDPAPAPQAPAPDPAVAAVATSPTVVDVVRANPDLSTFASLLDDAGLADVLADTAQVFTVFAPSNAAFQSLAGGADALRADPAALRARLLGHVVHLRLFSGDALGTLSLDAADGGSLTVDSGDGTVVAARGGARATVVTPDLDASNGVVHGVDTVLGR